MATIKLKRGTRANLDALAAGGGLIVGEPYLIADEARIAVGTSATTYQAHALEGEGGGSKNIDGGSASSVYLPSQLIDGGGANG